jgi:hypothetical protein
MSASVKIMLSYDYCHFEVCKGTDEELSNAEIDELRKDVQRLADRAVNQFQIAKKKVQEELRYKIEMLNLKCKFERMTEDIPESEWTVEAKAVQKAIADNEYLEKKYYDYDEEWEDDLN